VRHAEQPVGEAVEEAGEVDRLLAVDARLGDAAGGQRLVAVVPEDRHRAVERRSARKSA